MIDRRLQALVLFGTLAFFLYFVNSNILNAERRIASGTAIYLELAPVDPRSLIQGDYMVLDYQIERDARDLTIPERRGQVVATIDDNRVAHFDRYYTGGSLQENEILLNYTTRQQDANNLRIGVDSFFFQEGLGDAYDQAEYAETRVTPGGGVILIDLVGEEFETLVE
jgi:uncharacterized membrane-anchored protein